jgi:hypothetical protein
MDIADTSTRSPQLYYIMVPLSLGVTACLPMSEEKRVDRSPVFIQTPELHN